MLNIILIDDDSEEIEFMEEAISMAFPGSQCHSFDDCELAIAQLADITPPPNYIFIDVNMIKMNGEECLIALRRIKHLDDAKIIIMSSSMRIYEEKQRRLMKLGASAVAEKPDNLNEYGTMFIDAIRSIKQAPKATDHRDT